MQSPIRSDKLLILTVFVVAIACLAAYQLFGNNTDHKPPTRPPSERSPLVPSAAREFLGVALQLQSGWEDNPYEKYIDEIAATGADTVCLVVSGHQESGSSTSIFVDLRKNPSDKRLKELLAYCRKGDSKAERPAMKVVLMPIVLLDHPKGEEWRGSIEPSDWDRWWANYTGFVLHYAKVAQAAGVEVFMIGSELVSTETQAERWRELIDKVRAEYKGRLAYSANWDHYRPITFWAQLDMIGMTTYYDLTGGKEPTVERLKESWRPLKNKILEWRNANYPKHPIIFTEVGWPNQTTCAQYPWDYYRAKDKPDPEAQANCFEAFFETWMDEPAVAGYLVWEWRNHPGQATGPEDTSYVPCGKPAEKVIGKHYRAARSARATTAPAEQQAQKDVTGR